MKINIKKNILDHQAVRGAISMAILLILVGLVTAAVNREWAPDAGKVVGQRPGNVNYAEGEQAKTTLVATSAGGYISVWEENVYVDGYVDHSLLYAQKYNSAGTAVWASPVEIAQTQNTTLWIPVTDNADGVFVIWQAQYWSLADRAIYAGHVTSAGTLDANFGGSGGKIIIDHTPGYFPTPSNLLMGAIPDGSGGMVYSYAYYIGNKDRMTIQRINSTGSNLWNGGGTSPDHGTSAIYSFNDTSPSPFFLNNDSYGSWSENGMTLLEGANSGKLMVAASVEDPNISHRYFTNAVQRLDLTTGASELTAGGKIFNRAYPLDTRTYFAQITSDHVGGAYVSWVLNDESSTCWPNCTSKIDYIRIDGNATLSTYCADNGDGTYQKRLDADNQHLWTPSMVPDNNGGVYFAYSTAQSYMSTDVKLVHSNTCINTPANILVSNTQGYQHNIQLASDGSSGVYVSWNQGNDVDNNHQVHLQHVKNDVGAGGLSTTFGAGGALEFTYQPYTWLLDNYLNNQPITAPSLVTNNSNGTNGVALAWYQDMGLANSTETDNYLLRVDNPSLSTVNDESMAWVHSLLPQTPHAVAQDAQLTQTLQLSDGSYVVAWISRYGNNIELSAEKYNTAGVAQWNAGNPGQGVLLYTGDNANTGGIPTTYKLLSSGSDFILALATYPVSSDQSDLFIQKYSATNGSALWNSGNMINITNDTIHEQMYPNMLADGSGGAFMIWHERCNNGAVGSLECPAQSDDIQSTHFTSAGAVAGNWNTSGSGTYRPLQVDEGGREAGCHSPIVSNGSGGFYVTYESEDGHTELCPQDSEAQLNQVDYSNVSSTGSITATGQPAFVESSRIVSHDTVSDGADGFITAYDTRSSGVPTDYSLYAARVGTTSWSDDLIDEQTGFGLVPEYPQVVTNGNHGAIILYQLSDGNDMQVKTSYINGADGTFTNTQLTNSINGMGSYVGLESDNYNKSIVEDGNGGAILTYTEINGRDWGGDIHVQKVDATNAVRLLPAETIVETYTDTLDAFPVILPGSAQITWTRQTQADTNKHIIVGQYLHMDNTPVITGVDPSTGPLAGGTHITISGNNFTAGATTITVGGLTCQNVVVTNPQTLTCDTTAHAAGTVNATVTTADGTYTLAAGFTYAVIPGEWATSNLRFDGKPDPSQLFKGNPYIIKASDGNFISTWERTGDDGDSDIIVQKINKTDGSPMWTDDGGGNGGMQITDLGSTTYNQTSDTYSHPNIIPDNSGGAYFVYIEDHGNAVPQSDLMIQHVNSNGSLQYGNDPMNLSNNDAEILTQGYNMIADGSGGVYVSWQTQNTVSGEYQIFADRVTSAGAIIAMDPGGSGFPIGSSTPGLALDSSHNLYVAYSIYDQNTSVYTFEVQRFSPDGSKSAVGQPWHDTFNMPLVDGEQIYQYEIAADSSNNIIVVYTSWVDTNSRIAAQKINSDGTSSSWFTPGVGGTALVASTISPENPQIIPDGSDGVIAAWSEDDNGIIYAQKIDTNGVLQWGPDALQVSSGVNWDSLSIEDSITSDGAGGVILGYTSETRPAQQIVLQKINSAGELQWPEGAPSTSGFTGFSDYTNNTDLNPALAGDGSGGAVVLWRGRTSSGMNIYNDIYAQYYKVQTGGGHGAACTGGPGETCGEITIGCNTGGNISISNISTNATFEERSTNFYQDTTNAPLVSALQVDVTDNRGYNPDPGADCGPASTLSIQSDGLSYAGNSFNLNLGTPLTNANISCISSKCVPDSTSINDVATTQGSVGTIGSGMEVLNLSEAFGGTVRLELTNHNLEVVKPSGPIPKGTATGTITFTLL